MHEDSWPYLCFQTPLGLLAGTVLLFGDAQAPFTFHKITRPMVALAGILSVRVMAYLDDFMWMASDEELPATSRFAQWILPLLGWTPNEKCEWEPTMQKKFLGFIVDSESMRLKALPRKVADITSRINSALEPPTCPLRELERLVGKIIALKLAIPGTRAYTRACNKLMSAARRIAHE